MSWLDTVNSRLEAEDAHLRAAFDLPKMPVTFIIALPRGASTLFHQLVLSAMHVGYVSNVMARFWKAPYTGAMLQRDLRDDRYVSNFRSHFGNTVGPLEPHEWGWFWRHWLRLEGDDHYCRTDAPPDRRTLARVLGALEAALEAPLIFDNVFAMANIDMLRQAGPRILAAHVIRPPYYVCNSIIKARLARTGNLSAFYGHRPRNIEELLAVEDPVEQIVLQVKSILGEMERDLQQFEPGAIFTVEQHDFSESYPVVVDRFADFLAGHGVEVRLKPRLRGLVFENRNTPEIVEPGHREDLNRFYEKHIGPLPEGVA